MTKFAKGNFTAQLKTKGPFKAPDGIFFGVAKGLAKHFGLSVGLVRLIIILCAFFLALWPVVLIYLAAAIVMAPEPAGVLSSPEEREMWLQANLDPDSAMELLGRRSQKIEHRLRRLEDAVTSKDFIWQQRLKKE